MPTRFLRWIFSAMHLGVGGNKKLQSKLIQTMVKRRRNTDEGDPTYYTPEMLAIGLNEDARTVVKELERMTFFGLACRLNCDQRFFGLTPRGVEEA